LTISFFIFSYSISQAQAVTVIWDGGGNGTSWSDPLNWDNDVLPSSDDDIFINQNPGGYQTVDLDIPFSLSGNLTIDSDPLQMGQDYLYISSGLVINGGTLQNGGNIRIISSNGNITNYGLIINEPGGVIWNYYWNLYNINGTIENQGLLNNTGRIYNYPNSVIYNSEFGSIVNTFGLIYNYELGHITNLEIFINKDQSQIVNNGNITNLGTLDNVNSTITNNVRGVIHNHEFGTINNRENSEIFNNAFIHNNGTIRNHCGSIIINSLPNGFQFNPVIDLCDVDGDRIWDDIDLLPGTPSDDFSDTPIPTTGRIITEGDQILTIMDHPNPAYGVYIGADPFGGPTPAEISVCGDTATIFLYAGDEIVVTCTSVTIQVISGTVYVEFMGDDGTVATANIGEGNSIKFEPSTMNFFASENNIENVTVNYETIEHRIEPGTIKVVPEFSEMMSFVLVASIALVISFRFLKSKNKTYSVFLNNNKDIKRLM